MIDTQTDLPMTKTKIHDTTEGICSQDAVKAVGNRYDLVLIASQRVRELKRGHQPKLVSKNGPLITATMEVAAGLVGRNYLMRGETRSRQKPKYRT